MSIANHIFHLHIKKAGVWPLDAWTAALVSAVWYTVVGHPSRKEYLGHRFCIRLGYRPHGCPFGEVVDHNQNVSVTSRSLRKWTYQIYGNNFVGESPRIGCKGARDWWFGDLAHPHSLHSAQNRVYVFTHIRPPDALDIGVIVLLSGLPKSPAALISLGSFV
ncbi:unnamed protein product [Hymenolepis diminuta]|uniref:Uncharacterized protein n=1 Tax=Hymenolepis diminuta TaxID=6216 RepID=A0A564YTZ8_HYMDI|nr:unnamed protein product [Hymenolepis diminuta]